MATLRDIKRRITGVKNTQQITKAMKMVAAARLRRAQDNMINARPYTRKITEVLGNLLSIERNISDPLLEEREINNVAVVVITSDRGLCGAFNMNIIRHAENVINSTYANYQKDGRLHLFCVGKKGADYFSKRNYIVEKAYRGIFAELKFEVAAGLVSELVAAFNAKKYDKVIVFYNQFVSVMSQNPTEDQLLPIKPVSAEPVDDNGKGPEFIYEPDKMSIISKLLPRYLNSLFWKNMLESYAAELGARMTAMDMATENAKELIRTLNILYNKERQASITTEILEIVSGANALKG